VVTVPMFAGKIVSDAELLSGAKKGLFERSRLLSPDATLAAILDLKQWIGDELAFEEAAAASLGRALSDLWRAEYLDQLPPLLNTFERLSSAYFVRRGSVTAFHGFCNAWREGLLRRILLFAEEELELHDHCHPPAPYALLATGSLGRREQTLEETDRFFLVWREDDSEYFQKFAYRVVALLDQLGLIAKDGPGSVSALWRGSQKRWHALMAAGEESDGSPLRPELLSDLRHLSGDESVGNEALRSSASLLERCRDGAEFAQMAQRAVSEPVALGIFGGIRVERSGEQAGSFNVAQSGLTPLVYAVRLLSVQHGLAPAPTLDRLAALRTLGALDPGLVDRLEFSYHLLASLKIGKEITLQQPLVYPSQLSVMEQQKLKEALESVRQLQRVIRRAQLHDPETEPQIRRSGLLSPVLNDRV
jgi:CBS domain-containing protein